MLKALVSPFPGTPLSAWLVAARPKTLPAAVAPVLVGCSVAWAEGGFHLGAALAAFAVALLLQIGANLANDVADYRRGADTPDRLGPIRVTQSGLIAPGQMAAAAAAVLAAAAVPGLYLVWRGGPLLAVFGLLAMLSAVVYTAGPKPFGYLGFGELFVFVFFGPVAVAGAAYAMTSAITPLAIAASIPIGCLVTAILVVNNLRDIETDRAAGKRTLAVRIGRIATRWEFATLLAIAFAVPVAMWLSVLTQAWPLLSWASAPLALVLIGRVWAANGRELNQVLGGTARLCLWFAGAFAVGIIL